MSDKLVVKGRLVDRTTVELLEPVEPLEGNRDVEVLVPKSDENRQTRVKTLLTHLMSLPPGTRSREDIDRQIQEERDSWE